MRKRKDEGEELDGNGTDSNDAESGGIDIVCLKRGPEQRIAK